MKVSVREAKTHLVGLLRKAAQGEEVIIVRAGQPIAMLVWTGKKTGSRKVGTAKGDFVVPRNFNWALPKTIEKSFWQ